MAHSERCPICHGTGKYKPQDDGYSTMVPMKQSCHGCGGTGWVTVQDNPGWFSTEPNPRNEREG